MWTLLYTNLINNIVYTEHSSSSVWGTGKKKQKDKINGNWSKEIRQEKERKGRKLYI